MGWLSYHTFISIYIGLVCKCSFRCRTTDLIVKGNYFKRDELSLIYNPAALFKTNKPTSNIGALQLYTNKTASACFRLELRRQSSLISTLGNCVITVHLIFGMVLNVMKLILNVRNINVVHALNFI